MRIEGKTIYAEEGWMLRRKSDNFIVGEEATLGYTYYIGGVKLDEPHLEIPEDYEEVTEEMLREESRGNSPQTLASYRCENQTITKAEHLRTVVLENSLDSPLDCKEIKPVNPKGNQP